MKRSSDKDLSLCVALSKISKLIVKSKREIPHECGATRQHDVVVQLDFQVRVTLFDGAVGELGDTSLARVVFWVPHSDDSRVKECFSCRDALSLMHLDDVARW